MLVDNITLTIKAGNGGNGAVTFRRDGQTAKGGPDGGNGGNGGNVYFQGTTNINDLREFRFKKKILAENGIDGRRSNLFGKNAPDITILLPLGTKITDSESGRVFEVRFSDKPVLFARGGKGGRGNTEFKSPTNRTPMYAEKGEKGEEKILLLELRIIADIGLIGLPNAGKSSLLAVLTNARPGIGAYPFTTIEPNIGMMGKYALADIPGLIEGASEGKGLGIKFLQHIEKTKLLVHCIDVSMENPLVAYKTIRNELASYSETLATKPELILLTKTDLVDAKAVEKCKKVFEKKGNNVYSCSTIDDVSIDALRKVLSRKLEAV